LFHLAYTNSSFWVFFFSSIYINNDVHLKIWFIMQISSDAERRLQEMIFFIYDKNSTSRWQLSCEGKKFRSISNEILKNILTRKRLIISIQWNIFSVSAGAVVVLLCKNYSKAREYFFNILYKYDFVKILIIWWKIKILSRNKSLFFSVCYLGWEIQLFANTKVLMQYCQCGIDRIFDVIVVMIKTSREKRW
jgi:hypothetical protein